MSKRVMLLAALLFALAMPAAAAPINWGAVNFDPIALSLNGVALNTSPSFTLRSDGYSTLTVYVNLTRASATAVTMSCTGGPSPSVQAPLGVATVASSGAVSMAASSWTYPVSASGVVRMLVGPLNDQWVVCTLGATGAASGDTASVYVRLAGVP